MRILNKNPFGHARERARFSRIPPDCHQTLTKCIIMNLDSFPGKTTKFCIQCAPKKYWKKVELSLDRMGIFRNTMLNDNGTVTHLRICKVKVAMSFDKSAECFFAFFF